MADQFSDGRRIEGVILSPGDSAMRVASTGAEDFMDFASMSATWASENCFDYGWQQQHLKKSVTDADCVCSRELAARLIHLLLNGSEANQWTVDIPLAQPINDRRIVWVV
jgi:hypothetical protein